MVWKKALIECSGYAFRVEDLRQRFIDCDEPSNLSKTPGIDNVLETMLLRSIFEAMSSMGWDRKTHIDMEKSYPRSPHKNPKRCDLAFKDIDKKSKKGSKGKSWHYVEVKKWKNTTKPILDDLKKMTLYGTKKGRHAHMLIYHTRGKENKNDLLYFMKKNFEKEFIFDMKDPDKPLEHEFRTLTKITDSKTKEIKVSDGLCTILLLTKKL
jgi:hypothetical protein